MNEIIKKKSPWNELDFYKEGQPIYGRDDEIWRISNAICQNLQTIIYGQSGIGKSSLLFAGIFPRLRKDAYFPIFIRLGMFSEYNYADVIIDEIKREASRIDEHICKRELRIVERKVNDNFGLRDDESLKLWWYFNTTEFVDDAGNQFVPVLVFDQFEEILNNRVTHAKAQQFILNLYNLLDDTKITPDGCVEYSNYRIVISLREDYLYCLEDVIDRFNLAELRYNRYRINALSEQKAKEVITKTAKGLLEKDREDDICAKIINEAKNYMGEVHTLMLSLICSTAYINSPDGVIRLAYLENCDDQLYYYYSDRMNVVNKETRKYLEKVLITSDGRRNSVDLKEVVDSGKILQEEIDLLEKCRLIRIVTSGDNSRRVEFIHDKITTVINNNKQSFFYCIKHAILNVFNLNSRANINEYKAVQELALIVLAPCLIMYLYDGIDLNNKIIEKIFWLSVEVIALYLVLLMSTSIRRCHDFGISGCGFDLFKPIKFFNTHTTPVMYSNGMSHAFMSWLKHTNLSLSRKEYLAIHVYTHFYATNLFVVILPILMFLGLEVEYSIDVCTELYLIVLVFLLPRLALLRLPSLGIPMYFGVIPVIPWLLGFIKRDKEVRQVVNDVKEMVYVVISYVVLFAVFLSVLIITGEI